LISCKQKEKPEKAENKPNKISEYPTDREFKIELGTLIGLDMTELNFTQITNKFGSFQQESYGQLTVKFVDEKIKKRLIPHVYDEGLIKQKNI